MGKKKNKKKNDARGYATVAVPSKPVQVPSQRQQTKNKVDNDKDAGMKMKEPLPPVPSNEANDNNNDVKVTADSTSLAGAATPPLRFYKRIEALYLKLSKDIGFADEQIKTIIVALAEQHIELSLENALDWSCLSFETEDLPLLLTEAYVREQIAEKDQVLEAIIHTSSSSTNDLRSNEFFAAKSSIDDDEGANVNVTHKVPNTGADITSEVNMDVPLSKTTDLAEDQAKIKNPDKEWILSQYEYYDDGGDNSTNGDMLESGSKDDKITNSRDDEPNNHLPEEMELLNVQRNIEELESTLKDDASNYMRSKAEIKELKKELGQLKKKASKLRGKVEKAKRASVDQEERGDNMAPDENNDECCDIYGANMFGHDEQEELETIATTIQNQSNTGSPDDCNNNNGDNDLLPLTNVEHAIPDSWTGKLPRQIFEEYCRKEKLPQPTFSKLSTSGCSLRVRSQQNMCNKVLPLQLDLPGPFYSYKNAQQYVATLALWKLNNNLPFYRMFPPVFASLWKSWMKQEQEKQKGEDLASQAKLNSTVVALIDLLPKSSWLLSSLDTKENNVTHPSSPKVTNDRMGKYNRQKDTEYNILHHEKATRICEKFKNRIRTEDYLEMASIRSKLPMYTYREDILDTIQRHSVTILVAETGAGKTTQCGQFLLEKALLDGETSTNILCTQPRRVAAMSVADRVAEEMCEASGVGQLIGYQIRLESKFDIQTRLLFCTTGVVLRRFQDDPNLTGISHVLVDEVHERQWQIDFLLISLRRLIQTTRPDLKIVLMSATMDTKLFGSFFGEGVPIISVPGRTFPVANYFLEDLLDATDHIIEADSRYAIRGATSTFETETLWVTTKGGDKRREVASLESQSDVSQVSGLYSGYKMSTQRSMDRVDEKVINYDLIEDVLLLLISKENHNLVPPEGSVRLNNNNGAVLIFLPGFGEIRALSDRLQGSRVFGNQKRFDIVPLHSSLSPKDQKRAFRLPPVGCRKIILSTNIAETSVTISDVVAVIDCGLVREIRQDKKYATNKLVLDWCSRASAKQRSGRAGRVQEGICCKLFSSITMEQTMRQQAIPELQRVPLEEVCLNILAGKLSTNCSTFLQQAPEPPSETSIKLALNLLEEVGALDVSISSKVQTLTPLGNYLARLPVDVRLGKILIFGALFSCLDKALTIAASLSVKSPFATTFGNSETQAAAIHRTFRHERSDFLTLCNVWDKYQQRGKGRDERQRFCRENFLNSSVLVEIYDSRKQFLELLSQLGFAPGYIQSSVRDPDEWLHVTSHGINNINLCRNSQNENVIHAVISAGLYPNIARVDHNVTKLPELWNKGEQIYFHSNSTNYNKRLHRGRDDWVVFHEKFGTGHNRTSISTTAPISPSAVLLFGGNMTLQHTERTVSVDDWIIMPMAAQTAIRFRELRNRLDRVLFERIAFSSAADGKRTKQSKVIETIVQILQDSIEETVCALMSVDLDAL